MERDRIGERCISENEHQRRGRNNKSRGKLYERKVAQILSCLWGKAVWRNPDSGTKAADCESDDSVIEVKSCQTPTYALLRKEWGQTMDAMRKTGKKPYVVLTFVDDRKRTYWLVQRLGEEPSGE